MNTKAAFLMLLLAAPVSRAYDPNYCPFQPGRQPASQALLCEVTYEQQSSGKAVSLYAIGPGIILVIGDDDPEAGPTASLLEKGEVVGGPVALDGNPRLGVKVWAANLTSQKGTRQDVIIGIPTGGNGLAAAESHVCFFLRSKGGYQTIQGLTYHLDGRDFVDLNKDGRAEWIQTEFIHGCPGRDGKAHNYWVLNLIQFREGRPTLATAVDQRFPSWIWFTFKPNHQNTVQLTASQKQRLFREQAQGLDLYAAERVTAAK